MNEDIFSMESMLIETLNSLEYGEDFYISRSREGVFTPALTMWLMMCQKLKGGQSLQGAVEDFVMGNRERLSVLNKSSKRFRMGNISTNSGGYSQARKRLSTEDIRKITEGIAAKIMQEKKPDLRWEGKKVYLFDGTTLRLEHTEPNLKRYPVVTNQNGKSYTPLLLCGCMHDLFSGAALNVRFGPHRGEEATSEQRIYIEMVKTVPKDSLIVADRNLGIFAIAYATKLNGCECLVRLTKGRAKAFLKQVPKGADDIDIKVTWNFGTSRLTELEMPEDAAIAGRFIRKVVRRKGYKDLELLFFTTSTEPANKLVDLYIQRERIENDIRTLKYVVGMEMIHAKTPDMIEKEVLLGVAAYNLVRAVIAKAASMLKLLPRQISFTRAVNLTRLVGYQLAITKEANEKRKLIDRFLRALNQSKLPNRKNRRMEPRKIAHERQRFPRLRKSRNEEREDIKNTLLKFGNRGYFTTVSRKY